MIQGCEDADSSTCVRVDNPCKICLQTVTPGFGLQCQGACEAWVHYVCLNYTPGKIRDIEDGYITVTCPCPDCKTSAPKEFETNPPFTCNNIMCPANNPPSCEEPSCQANEASRMLPARCPPPGSLRSCGVTTCHKYLDKPIHIKPTIGDPCSFPYSGQPHDCSGKTNPVLPPPPPGFGQGGGGPPGAPQGAPFPVGPGQFPAAQLPGGGQFLGGGQFSGMPPGGGEKCDPTAMNQQGAYPEVVQQMCKTVGELAQQLNALMETMKNNGSGGRSKGNECERLMKGGGRGGRHIAMGVKVVNGGRNTKEKLHCGSPVTNITLCEYDRDKRERENRKKSAGSRCTGCGREICPDTDEYSQDSTDKMN